MIKKTISVLLSSVIVLSGCLSSSDSGDSPDDSSAKLSGVVAAGAPLAGFIAIKDKGGSTTTAAIDDQGNYSVDVQGLKPPFVLYASGLAGGRAYSIASAATVDDLGATVNVTTLTDLVVANVAGMNSEEFFNNPDFNKLTTSSLDTQAELLKARLKPILDALSVPEDFDLMNSVFVADNTGFDAALDAINVTVDVDTDSATITNLYDVSATISDSFSATESDQLSVGSVDLVAIKTDADLIRAKSMDLAALFRAGVPTSSELDPYFSISLLENGRDKSNFIQMLVDAAAASADNREYLARVVDEEAALFISIDNSVSPVVATAGNAMWVKDPTLGWQYNGNQQFWRAEVLVESAKNQNTGAIYNGLQLEFEDESGTTPPTTIAAYDYVVVTGPGLAELGYASGYALGQSDGSNSEGVSVNDAAVGAISDGSVFNFTRCTDSNADTIISAGVRSGTAADDVCAESYEFAVKKRPLLSTEAVEYPYISTPTADALFDFVSGNLNVAWTMPVGYRFREVTYFRKVLGSPQEDLQFESTNGKPTSMSIDIPAPGAEVESESLYVFTTDSFGRSVATSVVAESAFSTPSILGVWGAPEVQFVLFSDNTFLWAEVDAEAPNGMDVGTYNYDSDAQTVTLNVNFETNSAGMPTEGFTSSAVADAGELTLATIAPDFILPAIPVSGSGVEGVWKTGSIAVGDFSIFIFMADGNFVYLERDGVGGDGMEAGTYSYDTNAGTVTFDITYDDNAPGSDSGVGDVGVPQTFDWSLSNNNNTLSILSGTLVLNREF